MELREQIKALDGSTFPGKTFADCVLEPVFNVQRDYFHRAFLEISKAHAIMLWEQKIISQEDSKAILLALLDIERQEFSDLKYNPAFEDLFFTIEKRLEEMVGPEVAGKLHTARSRNDIGICEIRMALRVKVLELMDHLLGFLEVVHQLAEENVDTVMPAYTHTQPAQPTTLAHYLLAMYDGLERSFHRLAAAYDTVNRSPIGAAAITTTGFPINRERCRELLGFSGLVENSYDCIAGIDHLTETAGAVLTLSTDLSRYMKDILDFCTREFGVFLLADPYVQISSIMPQKRNPSSLEHTRPLVSKSAAEAKAVFDILHNTPFTDMVDSEEQLQPHLYAAIDFASQALKILRSVLGTAKINKDVLFQRAHEGFITATELADTLVRELGLSFRTSHRVTSGIIRYLVKNGKTERDITPEMVAEMAAEITDQEIQLTPELLHRALDPVHFVNIRGITGGPAPEETRRMLGERKPGRLQEVLDGKCDRLEWAAAVLEQTVYQTIA